MTDTAGNSFSASGNVATLQGDVWNGTGSWVNATSDWSFGSAPGYNEAAVIASGDVQTDTALTLSGNAIQNNAEIDVEAMPSGQWLTLNDASIAGGSMVIEPDAAILVIDGTLDGVTVTMGNDGEISLLYATGSLLTLDDDTSIAGGYLSIGGSAYNLPAGTLEISTGSDGAGHGATLESGLTVYNEGTVTVDTGAKLTLAGATIEGGTLADAGTIAAQGIVDITSALTGTGTDTIGSHATLEFDSGVASGQTVTFDDATGTLALGDPSGFGATVAGLTAGDTIDLSTLTYASSDYAVWTQLSTTGGGDGTLAIYNDSGVLRQSLNLDGIYAQGEFALTGDSSTLNAGNPGTDVKFNAISFNAISFNDGQINQESSQYDQYAPQIGPTGNTLQLTNDHPTEAASWFDSAKVSVASFTVSFDYQATPSGGGLADGFAFILQDSSVGLSALGGDGGSLGYGPESGGRGGTAISPSAAVELNLYEYGGSLIPGTNFATDGSTGSYNPTGGVDFADTGDTIQVVLSYNGSALTETLTDLVTGATYSTNYTENLESILGSDTAYVGFSAGNGGGQSTQIVSNFIYGQLSDIWTNGTGDGSWATAGNWSGGFAPVAGQTAVILSGGAPTIGSAITISDVTVQDGGTITVANHVTVALQDDTISGPGTIVNNGTVDTSSGTASIQASIANGGTIEATDGGTLTFADNVTNTGTIFAGANNTANNAGTLVDVLGTIINTGSISVMGEVQLDGGTITGAGSIANSGTIETTTAGGAIDGATIDNGGGTLTTGGVFTLDGVTINGGTLTGDAQNASFNVDAHDTLNLNIATVVADDGTTATLNNAGTVTLGTSLTLAPPASYTTAAFTLELTGAGGVSLNGATITATGAGETFENNGNDISGSGTIGNGNGDLTLDNNAGTIDATGGTLTIDTDNLITNAGTLQVDSAANSKLVLKDSSIDNTGTIKVDGTNTGGGASNQVGGTLVMNVPSDGTLTLDGNGSVLLSTALIVGATGTSGETLENDGNAISVYGLSQIGSGTTVPLNFDNAAGSIEITASSTLTFVNDDPVTNVGSITVDSGATLQIGVSTLDNVGTLTLSHGTLALDIPSNGTLGLTGGGNVTFIDGTITGAAGTNGETLLNHDDIFGYGQIGNSGTDPMIVRNAAGATIEASGNGQTLEIINGAAINNSGTLQADSGATLLIGPNQVNNGGNIQIDGTLSVSDAATPGATFALDDIVSGAVTTTGTVTLAGGDIITSISGGETFENNGNNISGYGTIGDVTDTYLTLDNASGVIDANVSGQTLTVDTGNTVTNAGTLEASGGGTLVVVDNVTGAGSVTLTGGGTAGFQSTFNQYVTFSGAGTLELTQSYGGTISGFDASASNDTIELPLSTALAGDTFTVAPSYNGSTTTLTITDTTTGDSGSTTVTLAGNYTNAPGFSASSSANGMVTVTETAPGVDNWTAAGSGLRGALPATGAPGYLARPRKPNLPVPAAQPSR